MHFPHHHYQQKQQQQQQYQYFPPWAPMLNTQQNISYNPQFNTTPNPPFFISPPQPHPTIFYPPNISYNSFNQTNQNLSEPSPSTQNFHLNQSFDDSLHQMKPKKDIDEPISSFMNNPIENDDIWKPSQVKERIQKAAQLLDEYENIKQANPKRAQQIKTESDDLIHSISDRDALLRMENRYYKRLRNKRWQKKQKKRRFAKKIIQEAENRKNNEKIDQWHYQRTKEIKRELQQEKQNYHDKLKLRREKKQFKKEQNSQKILSRLLLLRNMRRDRLISAGKNVPEQIPIPAVKTQTPVSINESSSNQINRSKKSNAIDFYFQSNKEISKLIDIRKEWDQYIVEDSKGSGFPNKSVSPTSPSSSLWRTFLFNEE